MTSPRWSPEYEGWDFDTNAPKVPDVESEGPPIWPAPAEMCADDRTDDELVADAVNLIGRMEKSLASPDATGATE